MKKILSVIIFLTFLFTGTTAFAWLPKPVVMPFYHYLRDLIDVVTTTPNDNDVLTYNASSELWGPEAAAASDAFTLKVDAGATADYFGVTGADGLFRFTANHFTTADGGNFVTLSLADHATARAALGLAIGTNVQAWDTDLDAWALVTGSANGSSQNSTILFQLISSGNASAPAWRMMSENSSQMLACRSIRGPDSANCRLIG